MKPVLLVITDGRLPYLLKTVESATANLDVRWERRLMVDDSGDASHAAELQARFPDWEHVCHGQRRGFCATVRSGWTAAVSCVECTHVLHLEEDFTFNQPVDLAALAALLHENPNLAQIALKRQPVNADEDRAGGFMETRPRETWTQRDGYVEHTLNFTSNPSLIPRHAIDFVLGTGIECAEMEITRVLMGQSYRFGYLGRVEDPPRVRHIGDERAAGWRI